ncbi:Proline dehydrogenase [Micractinium conductrix]|uniref:Proline dehydrogenase n=1 Tax=Micractinium conductrix TaxID=554055 RepID=A0A2P6V5Y7_9CHLO|nr:Proline dehydrogenase [Micractinium conductrix]|eukprot:PSC69490.1 Proline dehydrogenase [Micractinium conductrix]
MLRAMASRQGTAALAPYLRPAATAAAVSLHRALTAAASRAAAAAAAEPAVVEAAARAPERMEQAAAVVAEVMGGEPVVPPALAAAADASQPPPRLNFSDPRTAFNAKSTMDILRQLLVFNACKIGPLVANADAVLAWSHKVFGERLTNAVIRRTFYKQFVAGEDALNIEPTLVRMKTNGVRAILDYAAEDDVAVEDGPRSRQAPQDTVLVRTYRYESERVCDSRMSVCLKSIEAAHSAEGQGFAAIKVTALGLPTLLERTSNALLAIRELFRRYDSDGNGMVTQEEFARAHSELFLDDSPERVDQIFKSLDRCSRGMIDYVDWISRISVLDTQLIASRCRSRGPFAEAALNAEEQQLLKNTMARVERLAQAAADADVRLLVDAEHSYFQPAIDNTVTELQRTYNREAPRIYNTVQCYLKDSNARLLTELERARREKYKYGVKLVRGAYMVLERARAAERGYPSPIHDTVADTHANYDECVREMLQCVAREGAEVMVASHNQASIEQATSHMRQLGLPPSAGVYFGQLLGMADHLTYTLGAHGYGAYKYVPFGKVDEVMPYLIRRAQENSAILAGEAVAGEMRMLRTELVRRLGLTLQPPRPES